ncbi:MAG TPA: IS1595 family transposase [Croceicoccus sp.]|nr:IS1595 family transposase [Croceicoccus sp.]
MNIIDLFQSFQTQEQAVEYLEKIRWGSQPHCPYCNSIAVGRHASGDRKMARWQCRDCSRAFAVTVGTLFHGTHVPLRNWFLVLALMLAAKKSASAYQISRDLDMRRPTVWSMMQRIQSAIAADPEQERLLYGIVEADENYNGGKPRKSDERTEDDPDKRGRGTKRVPEIGARECNGRVVAQGENPGNLSDKGNQPFIGHLVDKARTILFTEYSGYYRLGSGMRHVLMTNAKAYAEEPVHTANEGFWALVKRAWYGSHRHYRRKYMHLHIGEVGYIFSRRTSMTAFEESTRMFLRAVA